MNIASTFKEAGKDVSSLFHFDRETDYIDQICPSSDSHSEQDPDIYSGIGAAASGFWRFGFDKDTNTIMAFTAKTPVNLRGERGPDGKIYVNNELLKRAYIPFAYRLKPDEQNEREVFKRLKLDIQNYLASTAARASKHFAVACASYKYDTGQGQDLKSYKYGDIFINSAVTYLREHNDNGEHIATFHMAMQRAIGSDGEEGFAEFNPHLKNSVLLGHMPKISKTIAQDNDLYAVRAQIRQHETKTLSKMWDEVSLYKGEDIGAKVHFANFVNYIYEHKKSVLASIGTSGVFFAVNPAAGFLTAVTGTVAHMVAHKLVHDGVNGSFAQVQKIKHNKSKTGIAAFSYGENCAAFFQDHKLENMSRRAPKARMSIPRFSVELLTANDIKDMLDHAKFNNVLQIESLRGLLLYVHQRGFSSERMFPDKRTMVDVYKSGMVRAMHAKPDGKIVIYGQHRPEVCQGEQFELPAVYVEQFNQGITRIEYDRNAPDFQSAFDIRSNVPYAKMVEEFEQMLFDPQTHSPSYLEQLDEFARNKSLRCIKTVFRDPQSYHAKFAASQAVTSEDLPHAPRANDAFYFDLPDMSVVTTPNIFEKPIEYRKCPDYSAHEDPYMFKTG